MITQAEWAAVVRLLRDAGRTHVMPRFRHLGGGDVHTKSSPTDLVTDADLAAEAMITAALHAMFPGCLVVGEEASAADPALPLRLGDAKLAFVVDPIDGTSNFVAGLPLFGVMAAAVVGGRTVAAAIHDPVGDDTAVALAGQGAWTEAPDGARVTLRVAAPVAVAEMSGCVSWRYMPAPLQSAVLRNLPRLGAVADYRCAAHQYRMLAAGHCHFMVFNRLMPWDHLPGVLLHAEAGGVSAHFDGTSYRPTDLDGGLICAATADCLEALRQALLDGA